MEALPNNWADISYDTVYQTTSGLFVLKSEITAGNHESLQTQKIGNLTLVYDENMEFIDEKWLLDIDSPYLQLKRTLDD